MIHRRLKGPKRRPGSESRLGGPASPGRITRARAFIEEKLARIQKLGRIPPDSGRTVQNDRLYRRLAIAQSIAIKVEGSEAFRRGLAGLCKEAGIRPAHSGMNSLTPLAKLCFPGASPKDHHRYARVLWYAGEKRWSSKDLLGKLRKPGGMTRLVRLSSRRRKKQLKDQSRRGQGKRLEAGTVRTTGPKPRPGPRRRPLVPKPKPKIPRRYLSEAERARVPTTRTEDGPPGRPPYPSGQQGD